jgi:hypothetical protein
VGVRVMRAFAEPADRRVLRGSPLVCEPLAGASPASAADRGGS